MRNKAEIFKCCYKCERRKVGCHDDGICPEFMEASDEWEAVKRAEEEFKKERYAGSIFRKQNKSGRYINI